TSDIRDYQFTFLSILVPIENDRLARFLVFQPDGSAFGHYPHPTVHAVTYGVGSGQPERDAGDQFPAVLFTHLKRNSSVVWLPPRAVLPALRMSGFRLHSLRLHGSGPRVVECCGRYLSCLDDEALGCVADIVERIARNQREFRIRARA